MMNDKTTTLNNLKTIIATFVDERDWNQFHSAKNLSIAILLEAGELLEKFQWMTLDASHEKVMSDKIEVEHEIADIVFMCLAFCNKYSIDLSSVMMRKIELNKQKYPVDKAKGRYTKYTKLDLE